MCWRIDNRSSIIKEQHLESEECVKEYSGVSEDISSSNEPIPDANDDISLNYVITPAKDNNGNILNANTYFHGHSHIH